MKHLSKRRKKIKSALVKLATVHEIQPVLVKSKKHRLKISNRGIYCHPAVPVKNSIKNMLLKKRRPFFDEQVTKDNLKIINLKLLNDGTHVEFMDRLLTRLNYRTRTSFR